MEGTIGEIRMFGGNFAPRAWVFCDGTLYSIAEYTAAYSIIGNTYGGDGITTFAVPDFRSRIPVGTDASGQNFPLGMMAGTETVTMTTQQMPNHSHVAGLNITIPAATTPSETTNPGGNILSSVTGIYSTDPSDAALAPITDNGATSVAGGSQPFNIVQPSLGLNYIVCMEGVYPSRN